MYRGPCQPCQEATDPNPSALQDGEPLPDYRHVPFVEVAERTRCWSPRDPLVNQSSRIASLLHRHLRDTRQRLPVLLERGGVAHVSTGHTPRRSERNMGLRGIVWVKRGS